MLPILIHYDCTRFGISSRIYGSQLDPLGGTGQGNRFLGDNTRDTLCLVIKVLENNE